MDSTAHTAARSKFTATLCGLAAILTWALLALLTDASGDMPPFQLAALTFGIGAIVCIAANLRSGAALPRFEVKPVLAGTAGLFGYHALYFAALRNAPAIEASLIAYLWPLLIVVGAALLPGERLRWFHVTGALAGFVGTVLIVTDGRGLEIDDRYSLGYALALTAAFTWATYSLASRRASHLPSTIIAWYCLLSCLAAMTCHVLFETTLWPASTLEWSAIFGLGLLPVGVAFFLWDIGMKHGHVAVLGAGSYAAPLLSSIILITFGQAQATFTIIIACLLITCGALLASRDVLTWRRKI